MRLQPPQTVRTLQNALHAKAKQAPRYRFYTLYDKIYRTDVLHFAYRCSLANAGAPGVDGQTFEQIETYGRERWLDELAEALRTKTYRESALRRVYIPKPDGSQRPLGIATITDRVVQTATLLVLEPIFEADLEPEQYAYRSRRSALSRRQAGSCATQHRAQGRSRCRPERLLRRDPAGGVDQVGCASHQRRGGAASDQEVA